MDGLVSKIRQAAADPNSIMQARNFVWEGGGGVNEGEL